MGGRGGIPLNREARLNGRQGNDGGGKRSIPTVLGCFRNYTFVTKGMINTFWIFWFVFLVRVLRDNRGTRLFSGTHLAFCVLSFPT
jgi:hypothetical protein